MPDNPATSDDTESGSSDWTTGQALGFLVALPGLLLIAGAAVAAMIVAGFDNRDDAVDALAICGAIGGGGLLAAALGTVVYLKTRRY